MNRSPFVSVIMPVYNGERYLHEAVESICNQTFRDFEFIIINDGSIDGTWVNLSKYIDPRLILVDQDHHGLISALNRGLTIARGEYIARMDSDDIAAPDRLEKQAAFLSTHPEVGILGTACRLFDANGGDLGLRQWPVRDLEIRWASLLTSPFAHPTVMIRRDILIQKGLEYDPDFQAVEDYDLWTRILRYTFGANLSEPLMLYRVHGDRVTSKYRELQLKNHDGVALRSIQEQLPEFVITPEQVSDLRRLFVGGSESISALDGRRPVLAEIYLDMFDAFISRYAGGPSFKALKRQEALKVARVILQRPRMFGWMRLLTRLVNMHPGLPWSLLRYLVASVHRRLRRSVADGNFGKRQSFRL